MGYGELLTKLRRPGTVFSYQQTAEAMELVALAGEGRIELHGRSVTVNGIRGHAEVGGVGVDQEDLLYLPPGEPESLPYRTDGLLLVCEYAPVGHAPDLPPDLRMCTSSASA